MKKLLSIMAVGIACCTVASAAPEYVTKNATGTTLATVYFPADALKQPRLVGAIATSDKAASVLSIRSGAGAYTIMVTNATTSSTTHWLNTTNGLAANDVLVLQKADGTMASSTVASVETNMVTTAAGGFGVGVLPGDQVYKMSAAISIKVGAATLSTHGPSIYAGNRGRPIRIVLDGTSACSVDSATAVYE